MAKIRLTHREVEIVDILMTKGSSNKNIAKELNITESTVKLHMKHILNKFAVKSRLQLVVFLQHHDWR